jgi:cytochrome P450
MMNEDRISTSYDPFEVEVFDYAPYEQLRRDCPIAWSQSGGWLVSRHEDLTAIALNPESFISTNAGRIPGVTVHDEDKMTFEVDPPRHGRLRKIMMSAMSPAAVRAAEPYIEQISRTLLDPLIQAGRGDFLKEVSEPFPGLIIAHFLGLPEADVPRLVAWTEEDNGYFLTNRTVHGEGLQAALPEFTGYIKERIAERVERGLSGDDVITRLIRSNVDDKPLTPREQVSTIFSIIVGAIHTSRDLLTLICARLAEDPELFEHLRDDRSLVPEFVKEVLRLDNPALLTGRIAVRDTEIHGQPIKAGDKMILLWASGNRDPHAFEEPDALKPGRPDGSQSLAFGVGRHLCIGAPLARLEGVVLVDTMLDLVESLSFDGPPPDRVRTGLTASYPELKVCVTGRDPSPT